MEYESDADVDEQMKNSSNVKAEGKVRVKKKIIHYYEFSVGSHQVPFPMCTLETLQKYCSTSS